MKVGLIDADSSLFRNLALMKLSAHHKARGDEVGFCNYWDEYDLVYISRVFDYTPDPLEYSIKAEKIIKGGTGYGLNNKLDDDIESAYPDYMLYGQHDTALGFLTRGCPRNCGFCFVKEKEGLAHKVADLDNFWRGHRHIKLLDPNILACNVREDLLDQLIRSRAYIDFNQGLDIRLMNPDIVGKLRAMRIKRIHFAYDEMVNTTEIESNLFMVRNLTRWSRNKVAVYILVNFNTTLEEDLYRIMFVKSLDFQPFVMVYEKKKARRVIRELSSWCNRPMFNKLPFGKWLKYRNCDSELNREVL